MQSIILGYGGNRKTQRDRNRDIDEAQHIDSKDTSASGKIIADQKRHLQSVDRIDKEVRTGYRSSKKTYTRGYKVHTAVDKQSGIISTTTFANTADLFALEPFVESIKDVNSIYADKAYKSKEIDKDLKQRFNSNRW